MAFCSCWISPFNLDQLYSQWQHFLVLKMQNRGHRRYQSLCLHYCEPQEFLYHFQCCCTFWYWVSTCCLWPCSEELLKCIEWKCETCCCVWSFFYHHLRSWQVTSTAGCETVHSNCSGGGGPEECWSVTAILSVYLEVAMRAWFVGKCLTAQL